MRIAIVAAACEFPEARTPTELWQLALHRRRCFRRFPSERLAIEDYVKEDRDPDGIYPIEAGLIEGYEFDRERFLIPRTTYERTDLAHWMALDVASRAILTPDKLLESYNTRERTAVIVANTLTGEFSRANLMRYRWPYVKRTVYSIAKQHLPEDEIQGFLRNFELAYKAPFPQPDEDSLAGALSNTIAGRIANHYGFRGGAHTVDGACASSLVAIASACDKLLAGDITCAIVGAVDLSLDPFELVGFARNGALARDEMLVFDKSSSGFWPGEGCAFTVLASESLVIEMGWPVLAWVKGVGMSTDGEGGLTRPSIEGQLLALRRAWSRSGLDPANVDYFEAHGTGTPTGDPVELSALAKLLADHPPLRPVPVGSIKANIGHTKAAAGMAGLLKAIYVCNERHVPSTTGCEHPLDLFKEKKCTSLVRVATTSEPIKHSGPVTVGVNSFGFGGINCHLILQGADQANAKFTANPAVIPEESRLRGELILLGATTRHQLADRLARLEARSRVLARSELIDLAASLQPTSEPEWRVCLVVETPQQLEIVSRDARASLLETSDSNRHIGSQFSWSAPAQHVPRVALLFPGQGVQIQPQSEQWARRFSFLEKSAKRLQTIYCGDVADTSVVQPALAEIALSGISILSASALSPWMTLGHSFGELAALHAAGFFSAETFQELAIRRGNVMRDLAPVGAMLAVTCSRGEAIELAKRFDLELACENADQSHVVAGAVNLVGKAAVECEKSGITCSILPTTRAFHSKLMKDAQCAFAKELGSLTWLAGSVPVASTITGSIIRQPLLTQILSDQLVQCVRFREAVGFVREADLIIEVGTHPSLVGFVQNTLGKPALPLCVFGDSLMPMLAAVGAAWVCGSRIETAWLYEGRLVRPTNFDRQPRFLKSPCGLSDTADTLEADQMQPVASVVATTQPIFGLTVLQMLKRSIAEMTGLPLERIADDARLLADLHLNSIRARQVVASVVQHLGLQRLPFQPAEIANGSLKDIAKQI